MTIFETNRLLIRSIEAQDKDYFVELMTAPEIIDPLPEQLPDMDDVMNKFRLSLHLGLRPQKGKANIWGVTIKGNDELIGLGAILTNNEADWELGYRFRKPYWGIGLGTELTKGLIEYVFDQLNFQKITADVDITNKASVRILEKFMKLDKEFYNPEDKCTDRRYFTTQMDWKNLK